MSPNKESWKEQQWRLPGWVQSIYYQLLESNWMAVFPFGNLTRPGVYECSVRTSPAASPRGTWTAQTLSQAPLVCVLGEPVYLARRSSNTALATFIYMVHSLRPACVGAGAGQKRAEWQKGYTTQLYSSRAGSRMLLVGPGLWCAPRSQITHKNYTHSQWRK